MAEQKPTNRERVKEIVDGIEQNIQELFQSEKYFDYLRTMSRFHSYSVNNTLLIHMQRPDAVQPVAGFRKWQQFGRHVKKGEKGLTIIAPTPLKRKIEEMKLDPDTKVPMRDQDGNIVMEEKTVEIPLFKPVKVFSADQTEGEPLPSLSADLTGNVEQYEAFMEALRRASPVPITIEPLEASTDGFFSHTTQSITVREGMSEVQTVCATVHEIAHAVLHNREQNRLTAAAGTTDEEPPKAKDKNTMEVEAESVSFAVCQYYGIDTSANSLGYIASWSKDRSLPELKASLETITKTVNGLISSIDKHFVDICKERDIDLAAQPEQAAPAAELPDTPEKFITDLFQYMDDLHRTGQIQNPYGSLKPDEVRDHYLTNLHHGYFSSAYTLLHELGGQADTLTVSELRGRLENLLNEWEAGLSYEIKPFIPDSSVDRFYLEASRQADDGFQYKEGIFAGSLAACTQLKQELEEKTITVRYVRELGGEDWPEPETPITIQPEQAQAPDQALSADDVLETELDVYPMPDPDMMMADLEQCGYSDGDLLPLSQDRAVELIEKDMTVYMIFVGEPPTMAFDRAEIEEQHPVTVFAVPREEWEGSPDFRQAVADRMYHQEERETAFLNHTGDCFAIYQLRDGDETRDLRYMPLPGQGVDKAFYELAYTAPLPEGATLDTLWEKFNVDHPADYCRPSMSMSDIIAIKQDGVVSCHYVDRLGFTKVHDFIKPENYLKNAELTTEDDYGMIDGIINNGTKEGPTVAELEAQVKVGQTISLMDLSSAVHRERGEKKSVMARLQQKPPQRERKNQRPKRARKGRDDLMMDDLFTVTHAELMADIVGIQQTGVPYGLFNRRIEPGYVLKNGTVLLESEKDGAGRYIGGAGMDGMYMRTNERYEPLPGLDGKPRAFRRVDRNSVLEKLKAQEKQEKTKQKPNKIGRDMDR